MNTKLFSGLLIISSLTAFGMNNLNHQLEKLTIDEDRFDYMDTSSEIPDTMSEESDEGSSMNDSSDTDTNSDDSN